MKKRHLAHDFHVTIRVLTTVGPEKPRQLIRLEFPAPLGTLMPMARVVFFLVSFVTSTIRSRLSLQLENAALHHQLSTYRLKGRRPRIAPPDRLRWSVLAKSWAQWFRALIFVQLRTVTLWRQNGFRDYWRTRTHLYRLVQECYPVFKAHLASEGTFLPGYSRTWASLDTKESAQLITTDRFIW
jgi:hypothetical protein